MTTIKPTDQAIRQFAYDTFQQEFPFKLYIKTNDEYQPTSQKWINKYFDEFTKHHPDAKIINFNNPEIVANYIDNHLDDYRQLMLNIDHNAAEQAGYTIEGD